MASGSNNWASPPSRAHGTHFIESKLDESAVAGADDAAMFRVCWNRASTFYTNDGSTMMSVSHRTSGWQRTNKSLIYENE